MPLVRIDVPAALAPERVRAVADAVHAAMVATINVPAADRFQVITSHGPAGLLIDAAFLDVARGPQALIVAITLRQGRSDDQKRALYREIVSRAAGVAAMRPEDIMVVLTENTLPDWSFGKGEAQYAPAPA